MQKLGLDPEKSALIRKSLNQQFNDKTIQEMMQQGSNAFPQHPIAVGDSWTTRMTLSNVYPFTVESTYNIVSTGMERPILTFPRSLPRLKIPPRLTSPA